MFFEKKAHFLGNKTVDQGFGANLKKHVFCKNLGAQHPNAGRNIQHIAITPPGGAGFLAVRRLRQDIVKREWPCPLIELLLLKTFINF